MSELLKAAESYAKRGWPVFPVKGKIPATGRGFKDASVDPGILEGWWGKDESLGVAIVTGEASGLVVLDVDPDHRGHETLARLEEMHGPLPETARVRTGSGGHHFYFAYPKEFKLRNSAGKLGEGLDIRGTGGYVVAPPSSTDKGSYLWEETVNHLGLAEIPPWIVELNASKPRLEMARTEGSRNVTLTSIAGTLRNIGLEGAQLETALLSMESGLSDEEVRQIAGSVSRYDQKGYPLTEAGQAELFASMFGKQLLFDGSRWYYWAGHWWEDKLAETKLYPKIIEAARYRGSMAEDEPSKKFASLMENEQHINAVTRLASNIMTTDPSKLDSDPLKLGVMNGVIDLGGGGLDIGSGSNYISRHTSVDFNDSRDCPRWIRFIQEIFREDQEVIDFVWKAIGYSFTGLTNEQCWFLCYGRGANGKSTFLETLKEIAGSYGEPANASTFVTRRERGETDENVVNLRGKRFVIAGEIGHSAKLDEERIKSLIGSQFVKARGIYRRPIEFTPSFKLWFAVNQKPQVSDDSEGFWRRIRFIPFDQRFSPTDDPRLRETLRSEGSGILNWVIEGARAYLNTGLNTPDIISAHTRQYRADNDHLGEFTHSLTLSKTAKTRNHRVYKLYQTWAFEAGYSTSKLWSPYMFHKEMAARFDRTTEAGKIFYMGISDPEEAEGIGY